MKSLNRIFKGLTFMHCFIARFALAALIGATLSACGGGGGRSSIPGEVEQAESNGVFMNGRVTGIRLESSGFTIDPLPIGGKFQYFEGEEVAAFLGNVLLGAAKAAPAVSFDDLNADDAATRANIKTNLVRFLGAFDADGDVSNGIAIPEAVGQASSQLNRPPFEADPGDFETDPNVIDALNHLEAPLGRPALLLTKSQFSTFYRNAGITP